MEPEGSLPCSQEPATCIVSILSPINPVHAISTDFLHTYFNIILSSKSRSSKSSLSLRSPPHPKTYMHLFCPHTGHMPRLSSSFWVNHSNDTWQEVRIMNLLVMQFPPVPRYLVRREPLSGVGFGYFHVFKSSCYGA
jgi:hypothetical protein